MFVVIKLVVFRARFVQSDKNLPQVVNLMKLSIFRKNKNDMNRSKMIANYNGFGLERVWIRTGLD